MAISDGKQSLWFRSATNLQSDAPLSYLIFAVRTVVCTWDGFASSRMNYLTMQDGMMKEAGHWSSSAWSPEWLPDTSGPGCAATRNGHVTSYHRGNQLTVFEI